MDVFWIVVVIVLLAALVGYVAYLYMKEAGPRSAVLWLTGSRLFRSSSGGSVSQAADDQQTRPLPPPPVETVEASPPVRALAAQDQMLMVHEDSLRELREEIQHELRVAVGRSREFDARLTRIEHVAHENDLPAEVAGLKESHRVEFERLQVRMDTLRLQGGAHGERQGQALADLYRHLAKVEAALAAVINPMLLPGEALSIPAELPSDALVWASWGDVGERAYAFGNVFNENRLVLETATGDEIAVFISILRQGLTGTVYPAIRNGRPSADQVVQLRAGLQTIVDALPGVRRRIESAYREGR